MPKEPVNHESDDDLELNAAESSVDETAEVTADDPDLDTDTVDENLDAAAETTEADDTTAEVDDADEAEDAAAAKDEDESDAPAKLTEKQRIARSKEIAAKARGKQTAASRRRARAEAAKEAKAKADKAKTDSMTKAQQRYSQPKTANLDDQNPVWFKPIMFGFLLIGLIWILVYYLSSARLPVAELGDWNLLIGIGISLVGFLMMTNWK